MNLIQIGKVVLHSGAASELPQRSIGSIRRCWGPRRKAIVPSDLSGIQRAGVSREG